MSVTARWNHWHTRLRRGLVPAAGALLLGMGAVAQNPDRGTLSVTITDASTGQPTPVRVKLTSLDGQSYDFPREAIAIRWGQSDRYEGDVALRDSSFYVEGGFAMTLPAGRWRVAVTKGTEFVRQEHEVGVTTGRTSSLDMSLSRWIDSRTMGWYSSDDHIHVRRGREIDAPLMQWIQAEDIHVGNILRMGDIRRTYYEQYAFGQAGRHADGDFVLIPGQEDPRTRSIGHTIHMAITQPVRDTSRYYLYDSVFDGARAAGGIVGYAHQGGGFHAFRSLAMEVPRGKIDFIEHHGSLDFQFSYHFLDLGYKMMASAGSDFPWGNHIGNVRFYTHVGDTFSGDAWVEHTRAAHTFVSRGPLLEFQVNGRLPGDRVDVAPGTTLQVEARAWGHEVMAPLDSLEVIVHGQPVRQTGAVRTEGAAQVMALRFELPVERGCWIAARVRSDGRRAAHTTPVYVTVDGGPFWNPTTIGAYLTLSESYLREIEMLLPEEPGSPPRNRFQSRAGELRQQIAEARTEYRQLRDAAQEAGVIW